MFRFRVVCFALFLVTVMSVVVQAAAETRLPKGLETKVKRYFSTLTGYAQGDLLTKSQLEDLQVYLRRTQGSSLVTHHKWRGRMLVDRAPLAKKFRAGGAPVLRQVSAQLGGYEELDRFSRNRSGRDQIQAAIDAKSPELLLQSLVTERERIAALPDPERKLATMRTRRIYTVADFLSVLSPQKPVPLKLEPQPVTKVKPREVLPSKLAPAQATNQPPVEELPAEKSVSKESGSKKPVAKSKETNAKN